MQQQDLSPAEWRCLQQCAQTGRIAEPRLDTLARLERMNLLMRGWGRSFVVTARGQMLLQGR
ncbi:MAG TPA: hypothetical protein VLI06_06860 [Solimonas sp.]|nr:hypothetical protein [Solimonas sp.]